MPGKSSFVGLSADSELTVQGVASLVEPAARTGICCRLRLVIHSDEQCVWVVFGWCRVSSVPLR